MKRIALAAAALLAATPALAHPGHVFTFAAGLEHPLTGADHLLAMALVGVWAAAFGASSHQVADLAEEEAALKAAGRRMWAWPATFVAALTLGAFLGHEGLRAPGVETMIALSVAVLGGLVALRAPASLALGVAGLAPLGFVHGLAHGAEAPQGAFWAYAAGFIAASAALHAAGVLAGRYAARGARALGAMSVLAGLWLAFS